MAITQISSKDDLSGFPSPKIHVFSKKTLYFEQPVKNPKDTVFSLIRLQSKKANAEIT
jgi:hypothetical protein